jgi:NRPS condensation-like uncharacterized protein
VTLTEAEARPQRVPASSVDLSFHDWGAGGEPVGLLLCEYDGHLDPQVLTRAGELLIEAEPVLGCRLVADATQPPYWERMPESVGVVSVAETARDFESFCRSGLDGGRDAQVAVCLWPRDDGDRLAIKWAHAVGDGVAMRAATARLSRIYSALELDPEHRPERGSLERRDLSQVLGAVPRVARLRAMAAFGLFMAPRVFPRESHQLVVELEGAGSPVPLVRQIPEPWLSYLGRYARQRGATLNEVILAAAYRALAASEWDGKLPLRIAIAVDLRRWCLTPDYATSIMNLASFEFPFLMRNVGRDFDETLERVTAMMRRRKRAYPGLAFALLAEFATRKQRTAEEAAPATKLRPGWEFPLTFTNGGVLEKSWLTFGERTPTGAHTLPPFVAGRRSVLGMTSYDGTLTLAAVTREGSAPIVGRYLDALLAALPPVPDSAAAVATERATSTVEAGSPRLH